MAGSVEDRTPPNGGRQRLLTARQIAARLAVSPQMVYSLLKQGKLAAFRVGTTWRMDPADFEAYLQRRRAEAGATAQDGDR